MRTQNKFQFSIANHDFIIIPQRLIFSNQTNGEYFFQLEKGCQRIKALSEIAEFDNNKEYIYRKSDPIWIKAFKQRSMGFCWSLYKNVEDKLEFIDTLKLDLNRLYINYMEELKGLSFQFSRVLQNYQKNSPILQSWNSIKSQLRCNKVKQVLKTCTENITFECIIEIKSNFDYLAEQQLEKKRLLKKGSSISEENNSSRNSLKEKSKVLAEDKKKTPKHKERIEKQEEQPRSPSSISIEDHRNPEVIVPDNVYPSFPIQKQGIMIMPQLELKNLTALSDIVEASNEQSIRNTGDRSDRKPSEQGLSNQKPDRSFKKTNTFHFGINHTEKDQYRRNNSLKAIKYGSKIDDEQDGDIQEMAVEQEQARYDKDELTNQSTIIKLQENTQQKQQESKITLKYFGAILLIFIIFLCSATALTPILQKKLSQNHRVFKSNREIKKNSLNQKLFKKIK